MLLLCDDPLDEVAAGRADPAAGVVPVVPLPSGGTMPCILALCLLRKYLLQNSF